MYKKIKIIPMCYLKGHFSKNAIKYVLSYAKFKLNFNSYF